jgi:GNAT superfamily N-acetyltransferase
LQDLFTVEAARGKGVGRALIEEVYRRAADAGCSRVYWLTHETNATAMKLYDKIAEKSGFIVYRKNF